MRIALPLVVLLLTVLGACSDSSAPEAPPAKAESAFKTQTEALDKAKEVEKMTLDAAEKQKNEVEQETN